MSDSDRSKRLKYKERTSRLLGKAYGSVSELALEHKGQNRGIAADAAAAFLSMGMDKLNREGDVVNEENMYSEDELEAIREMAGSASEAEGEKKSRSSRSHFMDKFLEKMVKHTIIGEAPEMDMLEERITDTERTKKPSLSIRILASNFKTLSGKMTAFFALQYGLIHVITWKKPTKTLCVLALYTSICLWPHLVLAYPLLFVLFGILIPGYAYCHPIQTPELIKVNKRGQSLWDFFTDSSATSIVDDFISDEYYNRVEEEHNMLRPVSSRSSDSSTLLSTNTASNLNYSTPVDQEEMLEKKKRAKRMKNQMNLLMNMRDLQNLTSDVLVAMNKGESFYYDTAGFKDEKLSTFIVYLVMIASSIIIFLGQFIPWRFIFIQSGWSLIILCHPNSKKYLLSIKSKKKRSKKAAEAAAKPDTPKPSDEESKPDTPQNTNELFERKDIIVDDKPEVRTVELYELQYKDLTSDTYLFYSYCTKPFNLRDPVRLSGKTPQGVDHLSKVLPPKYWKFDMSYANKWVIDYDPLQFLKYRLLVDSDMYDLSDTKDGWIYDNWKHVPDLTYGFRRRRLSRECFRYGRPPRRPTKDED